jgi:hypothetical protein
VDRIAAEEARPLARRQARRSAAHWARHVPQPKARPRIDSNRGPQASRPRHHRYQGAGLRRARAPLHGVGQA